MDGVTFFFVLAPQGDDSQKTLSFHVSQPNDALAWPVRVALGGDGTGRHFDVGASASGRRFLEGADADKLLTHLRTGGELHVAYSLCNGMPGRAILGQHNFAQSIAMFDACAGMSQP